MTRIYFLFASILSSYRHNFTVTLFMVFSEQCTFNFEHFVDPTKGQTLSTDCPLVEAPVIEVSLIHCKRTTCTGGGNILNYHQGTCEIRRCQGNDYMLSSARGGWHIYVLDAARHTAATSTTLPSKATSVLPTAAAASVLPGNPTLVHLTGDTTTMLRGKPTSRQDGVGWIPIAVPVICVCVVVLIVVVVTVVFIRKRKARNTEETVTYDNNAGRVATVEVTEAHMATQQTYYDLKSRGQPAYSEFEWPQDPTYEYVE